MDCVSWFDIAKHLEADSFSREERWTAPSGLTRGFTGGAQCHSVLIKMLQNAFQRRSRLCSWKHDRVQPASSIFFSFPPAGILKNAHALWILSRSVCAIVSFYGRQTPTRRLSSNVARHHRKCSFQCSATPNQQMRTTDVRNCAAMRHRVRAT